MKLKSALLAATLMVFAASTATSFAADEAKVEKTEATKTETGEAKKPAKKKVKKHSHAEEKSGMPMPESAADKGKQESTKHMDRHDHTKGRR